MKRFTASVLIGACALNATPIRAGASDSDVASLAAKYRCQTCHSLDKKLVGPSYRDVAKKYAGNPGAPAMLAGKIKHGSTGTWGAIPMPASSAPEADVGALVQWILALN